MQLAHEQALEELRKAQEQGDHFAASKQRAKNMRLISRLCPGKSDSLGAIQLPNGDVATDPAAMAKALTEHWAQVFTERGIDEAMLERWLQEDLDARPPAERRPLEPRMLRVKRRHVLSAILRSNNSAPRPDGIPFSA